MALLRLFTLTSGLHTETYSDVSKEPFIRDIEAALGSDFDVADFSSYGSKGEILFGSSSSDKDLQKLTLTVT